MRSSLAERRGARNIRVFGSVARGEAGPESDLDLLVEMEPGRSLLDHIALIQDLEEVLGCRVDVVPRRGSGRGYAQGSYVRRDRYEISAPASIPLSHE